MGPPQVDCAAVLDIDPAKKKWITSTGRSTFTHARGPYGDGSGSFILVPFRTLAVDTNRIPLGSVLYVASARGLAITLPSGERMTHDGYFFAADRGSAIKDNHVDVFCGVSSSDCLPSIVASDSKHTFEGRIVTDADVVARLKRMHETA